MSPISFIRIFLTATPVIEARPITLPILEGPHKLQPILSDTTDLFSPFFHIKNLSMWPCCSFIHPKAQHKFAVYFSSSSAYQAATTNG